MRRARGREIGERRERPRNILARVFPAAASLLTRSSSKSAIFYPLLLLLLLLLPLPPPPPNPAAAATIVHLCARPRHVTREDASDAGLGGEVVLRAAFRGRVCARRGGSEGNPEVKTRRYRRAVPLTDPRGTEQVQTRRARREAAGPGRAGQASGHKEGAARPGAAALQKEPRRGLPLHAETELYSPKTKEEQQTIESCH